jgi:RHH-type proline utilization regulon transcriptional repressor/proline dehydrogenase/delta 1-pyrroline-5-carboxylate dehydrogenase
MLRVGLHSLDEAEQARFTARMRAGNLYINRGITGAIVRRQPFGGMKASSFGPGAKAGGPNYVLQLCEVTQEQPPTVTHPPHARAAEIVARVRRHLDVPLRERIGVAACSYGHAYAHEQGVEHDPSGVLGERNVFRYRPCEGLWIRASADAELGDVVLALVAGRTAGARMTLSAAPQLIASAPWLEAMRWDGTDITLVVEDPITCANRMLKAKPAVTRVRCVGRAEPMVEQVAETIGVAVLAQPVLLTGRVELLAYMREQSVTTRYHRFGNLTPERLLPPLRS